MRGNGSLLEPVDRLDHQIIDRHVVFSSMRFTCNGTITAVRFLARRREASGTNAIVIGLGHPHDNAVYEVVYYSSSKAIHKSGNEYEVKDIKINYTTGDVLVLNHNYQLLHQMRDIIEQCIANVVQMNYHQLVNVTCTNQKIPRPLLIIETGNNSIS